MKKPFSLIFILFFLVIPPGFAQLFTVHPEREIGQAEIIVTYMKTFQRDSLDPRKRSEKMTLLIGENVSSFFSEPHERARIAARSFKNQADLLAWANNSANTRRVYFLYRVFKNYPEGEITTIEHSFDGHFLYTENLQLFDWEISGATDSISGYKVQKATTNFSGRDWVAWFTPEIPYNEGPFKFNGLPGLILKIHDTRNHYSFEVVSIEIPEEKTPIYFTEKTYIKTTKAGWFRAWESFRTGFTGRTDIVPDSHTRNVMSDRMQRDNNPIELIVD